MVTTPRICSSVCADLEIFTSPIPGFGGPEACTPSRNSPVQRRRPRVQVPAFGGGLSRVSKPQPGGQGQGPARDRLRPSVANFQSPTLVPPARDRLPASVRRSPSSQKIFSVQVGGRRRSVAGLEAPAWRAGTRARDRATPRIRSSVYVCPAE